MAWDQVLIELRTPSCPYAARLEAGQRIQCRQPGTPGGLAHVSGDVPGWDRVGASDLAQARDPCSACPVSRLPDRVGVECVDVLPGRLRIHAVCRGRKTVLDAYRAMVDAGEQPMLRRVRAADADNRGRWIDLGNLTPRQWEALEAAAAMGYFRTDLGRRQSVEDLSERLGCGRSAAHEHLRKALDRLIASIADES